MILMLLALSLMFGAANDGAGLEPEAKRGGLVNPIVFVTQVPIPADFATIGSTFGNHVPSMEASGRGGDLYILYPDGSVKNLTEAAGYGASGHQGANAIAVRDPAVHWDGNKVLFSMVIGAPPQFEYLTYYWQLYEISGLGVGETPVITKVANQPEDTNNVQPVYGSDDRIIFVSDRPREGARHLYPLLDEYEEIDSPSGLFSLDPISADLIHLNQTPSGAFTPFIDQVGRVVFTRWDHLQRDQQADADETSPQTVYGTFDYADESEGAERLDQRIEVFPEPRPSRTDLLAGTNLEGHSFNRFLPWQIHQDGTNEEILNHIGRHELVDYFNRSLNDDPNLVEFIDEVSGRFNENAITNFFHPVEDPNAQGRFTGIDAPEFQTHAAGQIITLQGPENADLMSVTYLTHRDTANVTEEGQTPSANHSGLYRDARFLANGDLIAIHTAETRADDNEGSRAFPLSRYDFQLKSVVDQAGVWVAGQSLTPLITKSITYFDPDVLVTYNGPLWQLNPVELTARARPPKPASQLPAIEQQVFDSAGVSLQAVRDYLTQNTLALVVSRNVTSRDRGDRQQPFNLRIAGTATETIATPGKVYDVSHMQFFQADHLRGIGGLAEPDAGRRVLARAMHDPAVTNPPGSGPEGSVVLGEDGSMAAFVPARRAMAWQLTDPTGTPVVRERYWLSFQPGEVRVCASCHGLNSAYQIENPVPENEPQALHDLLVWWRKMNCVAASPDLDGNGRVDVRDGVLLVNAIGQTITAYDLNCSGAVDTQDLRILAASW